MAESATNIRRAGALVAVVGAVFVVALFGEGFARFESARSKRTCFSLAAI
jgi:hypothetical protein